MWFRSTEFPMGRRSVKKWEHMVHVERNNKFEIKHDDGAMHCVIVRWLFMALCSECVNIIDGKLSFPLNQFCCVQRLCRTRVPRNVTYLNPLQLDTFQQNIRP